MDKADRPFQKAGDHVTLTSQVFWCFGNFIEEAETLKKLLVQQKDKRSFERVQALYLLKIRQVETVEHLAIIIGCARRTIQRLLSQYRSSGTI